MSDHEDDTDNEDGTSSASGAPFKNVFMVQSHLAPPQAILVQERRLDSVADPLVSLRNRQWTFGSR